MKNIEEKQRLTDDELDGVVGGLTLSSTVPNDFFYTDPELDAGQGARLKGLTLLVNNSISGDDESR